MHEQRDQTNAWRRRRAGRHLLVAAPLLALVACAGERAAFDGGRARDGARELGFGPPSDAGRDAAADARADGAAPTDGAPADAAQPVVLTVTNPVLGGDHPDPHVLRTMHSDGKPIFYLTATAGISGDLAVYASRDLVSWSLASAGIFQRSAAGQDAIKIGSSYFCHLWAPQIVELGPGSFLLSFSATRHAAPRSPCPGYFEDGGVYLAWAKTPLGQFADADHPWEPFPAGAHGPSCAIRSQLPRSVDFASKNCQGTHCHQIARLDSDFFRDPQTGRWWMAYSWFTNSPPVVAWEQSNHGQHVEIVELDANDPFAVRCDANVPQVFAANAHDGATLTALAAYCPRCGEMLSMTRGRHGEQMLRDGRSWGVVEGANLFRRGGYVYVMISGSAWDSPYYHVWWAAAPSVEQLAYDGGQRIVGRYLIPSQGQSFGHGSTVLGPDGQTLYFVYHHLDSNACRASGACGRDVWLSPIEFEDRGDGRGEVYIKPRFAAEAPQVSVVLP